LVEAAENSKKNISFIANPASSVKNPKPVFMPLSSILVNKLSNAW
jgi:hypothetical protein